MPTGQANRLMPTLRRVVLARQSAARSDGELLGAFVTTRDADAFAELVRRHGPMVLGVCRRVVGDRTTADDAFQASFLVLARRAAAVRPREQVGNWLYGVAYRTALKARTVLARRRSREKQVDVMPEPTAPTAPGTDWADILPMIDEELAKLPDKLRVPVVLCDLEGRPQREVAKHLNIPPATLATRLASARRTLAARLTRRGVTLSGGALAGLLGLHAAASAVPPALASGVVRAGEAVATGGAFNSLVSAHAVQLSEGVMRMMMLAKLKAVAVMAVTALALTTGLGLGLVPAAAGDDPAPGGGTSETAKPAAQTTDNPAARAKNPKPTEPTADDATFLRRLSLDVRGTVPTDVETWFFVSDGDDDKRAKVVEWITEDDAVRLHIAKKLGVPADRIRILRLKGTADGKFQHSLVEVHDAVEAGSKDAQLIVTVSADEKNPGARLNRTISETIAVALDDKTSTNAIVDWFDAGDLKITKGRQQHTKQIAILSDKTERLAADPPAEGFYRGWVVVADDKNQDVVTKTIGLYTSVDVGNDTDAEFLKRVLTDVRGSGPTALETKYFTEDKDPKKREKLIDTLLKDPAVQKKLGDAWKAKMLAPKTATLSRLNQSSTAEIFYYVPRTFELPITVQPLPPQPPVPPKPPAPPQPDKFDKLVGELIAAKKTDEAILEALTLATLSRLPTDSEKKLTLASIGKAADRKAAWVAVAKALAPTEATRDVIYRRLTVEPPAPPLPPKPPAPPVPPAKP